MQAKSSLKKVQHVTMLGPLYKTLFFLIIKKTSLNLTRLTTGTVYILINAGIKTFLYIYIYIRIGRGSSYRNSKAWANNKYILEDGLK